MLAFPWIAGQAAYQLMRCQHKEVSIAIQNLL
jgi:hypothetical protein